MRYTISSGGFIGAAVIDVRTSLLPCAQAAPKGYRFVELRPTPACFDDPLRTASEVSGPTDTGGKI